MSRRSEELVRIRAELAAARQRTLDGPNAGNTGAQPLLDVVALRIGEVSPAWRAVLRGTPRAGKTAVAAGTEPHARTPRGMRRDLALGVELIYEGWAMHAGAPRLTEIAEGEEGLALLIGDWCYAAGLCEVADTGHLDAVAQLAALVADLSASNDELPAQLEARWDAALDRLVALTR